MNELKKQRVLLIHKFLNIIIILFSGFLLIYGVIGLMSLLSLTHNINYNHLNYKILLILYGIASLLAGILSLFSLITIDKALMAFYDKPSSIE